MFVRVSTLLLICIVIVATCSDGASTVHAQNAKTDSVQISTEPIVARYLYGGKLTEGEQFLQSHLAVNPDDDNARFELGTIKFFRAIEYLGQQLYSHGKLDERNLLLLDLPFIRLPVPANPEPQPVSLPDIEMALKAILQKATEAERVLSEIKSDEVTMTLDLSKICIDYDERADIDKIENISETLQSYRLIDATHDQFVDFDKADVIWLRGYCHLVAAMAEFALAVDMQELWDVAAVFVFPKAETAFDFLKEEIEKRPDREIWDTNTILDLIASIHNLNFPVKHPLRLQQSHEHLKSMVNLSRENWKAILVETDDAREWVPGPEQTAFDGRSRVSKSMVDSWHQFLDEWEAILDGKKLIPFWRGTNPKVGVNLRKAVYESHRIDVVLWIQGSAAVPFLEEGNVTDEKTWREFQAAFRGNFFGFAIWFN